MINEPEKKFLYNLTRSAGEILLDYYKNINQFKTDDLFPTTRADKDISDFLYPELKKIRDIPILDEERDDDKKRLKNSEIWIVDPIDGTKDFVEATGDFCIMLALIKSGQPVFSIIYKPTEGDIFTASKGQGAYKIYKNNETEILKVNHFSDLPSATVLSSRYHPSDFLHNFIKKNNIKNILKMGSMGLKLAKIASGQANIYINEYTKTGEWDVAPGVLLVQEAGGFVGDINGNELVFNKENPKNKQGILAVSNSENLVLENFFKNKLKQ